MSKSLTNSRPVIGRSFATNMPTTVVALAVIITVGLFLLLVKLGFWQLQRAQEKILIQRQLNERQQQAPLTYTQLQQRSDTVLTGYRLTVTAVPQPNSLLLLDNQTYQGEIGYLAYQIISISPELPHMLLELGFVAAPSHRADFPKVDLLQAPREFTGRLYQKSANPLSNALHPEAGNVIRIQNLNFAELSEYLQVALIPAVLQVSDLGNGLAHPWLPIPMSAQKHRGYALQWFSLALALVVLVSMAMRKRKYNNDPVTKVGK